MHYDVIQQKIIEELKDTENRRNRSRYSITTKSKGYQIKDKSEEIMRDLFKYWNIFDKKGNKSKSREKDIINKVLKVKIENFNEWLDKLLGLPPDTSRNRYTAHEYFLCHHLRDESKERRDTIEDIFNCLKQIHECKKNNRSAKNSDSKTRFERDQQLQKKFLDSLVKNFIAYMIKNKNDYLMGFRKSMNDVAKYVLDAFYTAKEQQFKDLEFLFSTQIKYRGSYPYDHDFEKFEQIASSHAFFQPYFIDKIDYIKAKVDIDVMIEKIVNDPAKSKSEKVEEVIKLFEENTDIYFTSYGGPDRQYDESYYQIFLNQKRRSLNDYFELENGNPFKTNALVHLTDTAYDWAMTFYNVGETTDNMSEYKNLKDVMEPIKKFLDDQNDAMQNDANVSFNSEIMKITNFEYEVEKLKEGIFSGLSEMKDQIIAMPRFYNILAKEIGEKALYKMLHPNGKGRPYWDSNANELIKFIYMRLKHINEIFDDAEVVRRLKIAKGTPIVLKKIQLSLFFMDVFPDLMPVLLKIKDKFKYDDFDSDEMFILHTEGQVFKIPGPGKPYDPVRLETVKDEQIFVNNLIERANCAYVDDGNKEKGMDKLKKRLQKTDSPKIEPSKKMAAEKKLAKLIVELRQNVPLQSTSGSTTSTCAC